ncbi:PHP domain-containing protein [Oscillibacter valericigenes]|uniref:PHP domain-containing protein n=1 Tax=Oscillibacter valericigenes TaxID=351091 RepID=UPI001956CE3B|nr:PHP domain-containing protein [Oscillibacter valericigenes]MBM6910130.1 histidinol phosphate phosphatase [Oscillibacter valericigenes]
MRLTPECGSVHTHSVLCDGKGTLAEMAAAAYQAGVRYFGASGHSHTEIPHDAGNVLPADLSDYRSQLLALRDAYAGRMEILLGIEQDSRSPQPVPDWTDYWIGSVHNLYDPRTGKHHCVDWDREKLSACRDELFGGDMLALTEGYYRDVAAMAERKPVILGHIDLVTKLNRGNALFDEEAPRYRAAALEALHHADPDKTLLEINTGAISRGCRDTPYPAAFLLREWRAMGGQVILTADAHSPETVIFGYRQAAALARAAGYRESVLLTGRGWEPCPL